DSTNHRIRKVMVSTGLVSTIAGNGTGSFSGDGGPATSATLNSPAGLAIDSDGNIYFADVENQRIRKIEGSGAPPLPPPSEDSEDADIHIDVNDFLSFAISNVASGDEPAGNQPFGAGAQITGLTPAGSNAYAISGEFGSPVFTQLETTTNSTDGYNVTAYASDAGGRTNALLRIGGTGGVAADEISDSISALAAAQAANEALTTSSGTGLAFRVADENTSSILRE